MGAEFGHTPARKRLAHVSGEFTGDGFNAHGQLWRGKPGVGRGGGNSKLLGPYGSATDNSKNLLFSSRKSGMRSRKQTYCDDYKHLT